SLRDILVSRDHDHAELAVHRANRYFDAILVHSDPKFARLEESFHPRTPLTVPETTLPAGQTSGQSGLESRRSNGSPDGLQARRGRDRGSPECRVNCKPQPAAGRWQRELPSEEESTPRQTFFFQKEKAQSE